MWFLAQTAYTVASPGSSVLSCTCLIRSRPKVLNLLLVLHRSWAKFRNSIKNLFLPDHTLHPPHDAGPQTGGNQSASEQLLFCPWCPFCLSRVPAGSAPNSRDGNIRLWLPTFSFLSASLHPSYPHNLSEKQKDGFSMTSSSCLPRLFLTQKRWYFSSWSASYLNGVKLIRKSFLFDNASFSSWLSCSKILSGITEWSGDTAVNFPITLPKVPGSPFPTCPFSPALPVPLAT